MKVPAWGKARARVAPVASLFESGNFSNRGDLLGTLVAKIQ